MFVENLTIDDYMTFMVKDVNYTPVTEKNFSDFEYKDGRTTFYLGGYPFEATDFSFFGGWDYLFHNKGAFNASWLKFMYSKFGQEYADAFFEYRASSKDALLQKVSDKYDEDTLSCQKVFDDVDTIKYLQNVAKQEMSKEEI